MLRGLRWALPLLSEASCSQLSRPISNTAVDFLQAQTAGQAQPGHSPAAGAAPQQAERAPAGETEPVGGSRPSEIPGTVQTGAVGASGRPHPPENTLGSAHGAFSHSFFRAASQQAASPSEHTGQLGGRAGDPADCRQSGNTEQCGLLARPL